MTTQYSYKMVEEEITKKEKQKSPQYERTRTKFLPRNPGKNLAEVKDAIYKREEFDLLQKPKSYLVRWGLIQPVSWAGFS